MSETEGGAQIGKEAPKQDSLEAKTKANDVLAAVRAEAKKLINDLENIPAEVIKELHVMFDAFHKKASAAISEAPAEPVNDDPAAKSVASDTPQEL